MLEINAENSALHDKKKNIYIYIYIKIEKVINNIIRNGNNTSQ